MNFLETIRESQHKGFELLRKKNADYAGKEDSFKNFDIAEKICNVSSEKAILIRMCDKITRIGNLLDQEAKVNTESIEDTLLDLANYSYILLAKLKQEKKNGINFLNN